MMIHVDPDTLVSYVGSHLDMGPLPAAFYFSLSAEDSLGLDPFNQPVQFLSKLPIRVFSLTLPAHEDKKDPHKAMSIWQENPHLVEEFITHAKTVIYRLLEKGVLIPEQLAIFGLSRGGFIAAHLAAHIAEFKTLLAFAPLTQFDHMSIEGLSDKLFDRKVRFYIGNHDTRVGTDHCFHFINKLSKTAFEKGIRSPQVELIISPSTGQYGHGTPKEIFFQGAEWLAKQLGVL